ncbi:hypothetical protein THARTR1_07023 [Trichoderma harzianum]|uniref:CCD97-like C-terminal domain-containing protein n=1 Tax=Trichoderma harzianum TaxID=5544 RepID=A0A2K0U3R6_TRIHA|nr:hypothetical protein THARTR1_07023 [Trichoderma harzianum]
MPASLSSSPSEPSLREATPDDKGHDLALDRPLPRRPRTPAKLLRLGVRNRRHEYLVQTPSYFDNLEHELAGMISHLAEGNAKGYSRTLEADIVRGETNLSNLYPEREQGSPTPQDSKVLGDGGAGTNPWDADAEDKEHGRQLWHAYLEVRFVEGLDEDFDYEKVDDNYKYDTMAIQDAEDAWFDDEEPSWVDADQFSVRLGETGVQDF